ncbi:MAG: L,D-transpeptidase [Anaerolineales bacterium]|jgi:hypothetical protein
MMLLSGLIKTTLLLAFQITLPWVSTTPAFATDQLTNFEVVLCLPDTYANINSDCLAWGPSQYLTQMAEEGINFPPTPLPARTPDPNLISVPYLYGKIITDKAPLYGSLEAAQKGKPILKRLESGRIKFISYVHEEVVKGKRYYMIDPGVWMTANDVHHYLGVTYFQGLRFTKDPLYSFGWILKTVETKRSPGYQTQDYTGRELQRFDVVQFYSSKTVDGLEWYRISPDEWVEQRVVARVIPSKNPPDGVDKGRWIEINLYEQTLSVYDDRQLIFATLTSTGVPPFWTRPGLFQIYSKLESTTMQGAFEADRSDYYYLEDVPWTMYYDEARALHGAYWHTFYGYVQSHGCVNLSPGDAHWLFDWAQEGDWVYVWDPSGETPVDDDLYSEGGA